ncbi:universal stress protein [Sphingomonas ginsenosidivorax]|uniref:Universal stress protein n=2 Tax=Sphingomonas ginsenosidivorax TaxID=862135 RepID=A0A5C6UPV8_9SPHN|nr:universal stress protein [Sphingomonas ginsenosidivorax]
MVHLDAGCSNAALLATAAVQAERFGAGVIGVAAAQPVQIGTCDGYYSGDFAAAERGIVDAALERAQSEFRDCAVLAPYAREWRSIPTLAPIADVVAAEARSADLVIAGIGKRSETIGNTHADIGDLVLRAGRPVLVVPPAAAPAVFETVMVAWNDSRECRRAVADALPFLKRADRVVVAAVTAEMSEAHIEVGQVVAWLERHGVTADRHLSPAGRSVTERLSTIATEHDADLIVAGAYGHSRIREWAFGGVTRDMLLGGNRCALLSN